MTNETKTDELVWKGRFIVTQDGGVDLPHDRQHVEGPTDGKARVAFLNKLSGAMPSEALFKAISSKLKSREINTREAGEVVLLDATHEGDHWLITANSKASAGYCYVEARIVPESPEAPSGKPHREDAARPRPFRDGELTMDEPTDENPPDPNVYARVLDATIAVARSAPEKPGTNVFAAKIAWSKITELRDALDAAEIPWR